MAKWQADGHLATQRGFGSMIKRAAVFTFAVPSGWNEFREGNRYIFHGPNREELIVSASLIQGGGTAKHLAAVQQRLFQNAEQSVRNAASHPALKVMEPFARTSSHSPVECWTLRAETREGDLLFHQAVFRDPRGVLLATLEAPNVATAAHVFEQFLDSVGVNSLSEVP